MTNARRLMHENAAVYMNDTEVLAALLGTTREAAAKVLEKASIERLARMNFEELRNATGLTAQQSAALVAATLFSGRASRTPNDNQSSINCPQDIVTVAAPLLDGKEKEEIHVFTLNVRNIILSQRMIYRGNVNSSTIRPAEILSPAVITGAPAMAMVHNHPSGDPTPSTEDIAVTKEINAGAKLLGINLLDHVIIAAGGRWISLKERKMLE